MFAGAAREAVFTNPAVTQRVAAEFVPVALKAALVNGPPDDDEGRLYARIGRSKPAPQGVCATDGHGRALVWTLGFDDAASIPRFLDHVLELYRMHRDDKSPFATERFRKYPSQRLADTPADATDAGASNELPSSHPAGHACDGLPHLLAGTLVARVVGRALASDGTPVPDTDSQERYVEDTFDLPPIAQAEFAAAAAAAGAERFRVPEAFSRWWVEHAYLGQLDVKPTHFERIEFFAKRTTEGAFRIEGDTEASGGDGMSARGDGAVSLHAIRLTWEGFAKVESKAVTDLVLIASGTEHVRWGNVRLERAGAEPTVAHLMGGKAFDQDGGVRYGIIAGPVSAERTCKPGEEPTVTTGGPPESLLAKFARLKPLLKGLTPDARQPIEAMLQGLDALAQAGRFAEVEAVVDRALARAENAIPPGGADGVQSRLERIHEAIRRLVEAGKVDEAIALLDKALKAIEVEAGTKEAR